MNTPVKPTAEEARINSVKLKRTPNKAVPAPALDEILNPLLPNKDDDSPNQLHSRYQGQAITIDVPEFDQDSTPGLRVRIYLVWQNNRVEASLRTFTTPIDSAEFPLKFMLLGSETANAGEFNLGYSVYTGGNPVNSETLTINIDKTPPNGGNAGAVVQVPPEVEADGITEEYLAANDDKVVVTVPPNYGDAREDDEVVVYLGNTIPTALKVGTVTRAVLTDPVTVELTRAMLEGREGDQRLFYTLADRKGNIGNPSAFKTVNITLVPAPTGLQPPKVPVADDGEIDRADAIQGVVVVIDPYTNWGIGDQVVVAFDGVERPAQAMPQTGATVDLPYSAVLNGNPGLKDSRVTYKIVRGNREFPESVGFDTKVDLRAPGPVDPTDPPGVVHPDLALPVVMGAVSTVPDELTEEDANQPATASVDLYGLSKAGDVVRLYWNTKPVPDPGGEYRVLGTEPPTFKIPFTIPWALIEAEGNSDALPVHYTVAHPATNPNVITSGAKSVRVMVSKIAVPESKFQFPDLEEDPSGNWFNCSSVQLDNVGQRVIVVAVAGGEPKLADQQLAFTYQGWSDEAGTIPVPGNEYKFTFTPTAEQARNGFVVNIPYDPWFLTTVLRHGSIDYTAIIDGFPVRSERHLGAFWMASAGQTCQFKRRVLTRHTYEKSVERGLEHCRLPYEWLKSFLLSVLGQK